MQVMVLEPTYIELTTMLDKGKGGSFNRLSRDQLTERKPMLVGFPDSTHPGCNQ